MWYPDGQLVGSIVRHVWKAVQVQLAQLVGSVQVLVQVRDWHVPQPVVSTVPARQAPSPVQAPYAP